ncbi:1,2-phenylacetyl-CoA epoxidase subunit PaaD [Pontibacter sp. SGAir0037]|uniref:1,2-phenylacetyl-CoA epoxidase subunit PaaD n=1 Tax=Pontibacter sp. SGAir0037 TaxID=2571030 RepID=UPI0010CD1622|nr:1,2-phenylacetyl-CoA epoxidase subunit PaaD [Pontibacter sp. SGAir0037]QCR22924.1 phenylacetate-CoA oxygenase subunit PaaJ [Pontibacter sp. SGAir0037]
MPVSKEEILLLLEEVKDPEIPVLSLLDLGVITGVEVAPDGDVKVHMTPTFAGCPAMEYMKKEVELTLEKHGITSYTVSMTFDEPWNSNKISEKGRKALKEFGLAPPPQYNMVLDLEILEYATCPYCNSTNTTLRTPFGPTLCRSMHYCNDCRQMFEQFKPL